MKHSTSVRIDKNLLRKTVFVLVDVAKGQIDIGRHDGRLLEVARRLLAAEQNAATAECESGTVGTEAVEAA